ncbi:MAG: YheU family protein [Desulfobacterales bacterium]|nr:YheU family protein [Desulfobacterales bacterium]
MKAVRIPYDHLSPEALEGVVEEFVTRDGTDYGEREVSLETKINQVMDQLRTGTAVIVFDAESETCNIFRANDPVLKGII